MMARRVPSSVSIASAAPVAVLRAKLSKFLPVVLVLLGVGACLVQAHALLSLIGLLAALGGVTLFYVQRWGARFADPRVRLRPRTVLLFALWFGVVAGFLEVAVAVTEVVVLRQPVVMSVVDPYAFQLIPIPDLLLLGSLGLALAGLGACWPRALPASAAMAVLVGALLAFVAPLWRLHPELDGLAALLLATGLAFQSARWIGSRAPQFTALVRRTAPWPLLLLPGSWIVIYALPTLTADPARAAAAAAHRAPNVLLVVMDTVRADALGCQGYSRNITPNLDRFAARSVRFARALSPSPWTLPAHASMFTGCLPHEIFPADVSPLDGTVPLPPRLPVLAEVLGHEGYATAGFIANTSFCSYLHGLDRGFDHYEDFMVSAGIVLQGSSLGGLIHAVSRLISGDTYSVGRKSAADVNAAFLHWLSGRGEQPFFAFLNYFDAHSHYELPAGATRRFSVPGGLGEGFDIHAEYSPAQLIELRGAYDDCIAYLDQQLGLLLEELERRGELDNTVVIVTSDHGEQFGEHGIIYHGNSLYRPLLHVPLLLTFPGNPAAGTTIDSVVSLRDLAATVMDLAGIVEHPFSGRSWSQEWSVDAPSTAVDHLAEILVGNGVPNWLPATWPVSFGGMQAIVTEGMHLIERGDGATELYDFERDPAEAEELSRDASRAAEIDELRARLRSLRGN